MPVIASCNFWLTLSLETVSNCLNAVFVPPAGSAAEYHLIPTWMVWCLQVSGATMRPQQTLSSFNFRSLPRAADIQHHRQHHAHHCHSPQQQQQQPSHCQSTCIPVTAAHAQHPQPYADVSSMTASAQVYRIEVAIRQHVQLRSGLTLSGADLGELQ